MILKFGINVGHDLLYYVKQNQHAAADHSLYLSIFLSIQARFLLQISQLPEFSNFVYTLREGKYTVGKKNKSLWLIFAFFFHFPFDFEIWCKC